jgi:hypothetical protein
MAEWLDIPGLSDIMLPAINKLTIKNHRTIWNAMSVGGVVCMPNYVSEGSDHLGHRERNPRLPSGPQLISAWQPRRPCRLLRQRSALAYTIKESHFGFKFLFQSSIQSIPEQTFLTSPIKADLFPVHISDLDKNKTDYLKTIVSVRPEGELLESFSEEGYRPVSAEREPFSAP